MYIDQGQLSRFAKSGLVFAWLALLVAGGAVAQTIELTEGGELAPSDGAASDQFGHEAATSLDGNTLAVGAPYADGRLSAVYIFERNSSDSNSWQEVRKVTADDIEDFDSFGISVAIFGDTLVVGAESVDTSVRSSGAAYVFQRNQGGINNWGQVRKLQASDAERGDAFGTTVAIHDDTILVGAPAEETNGDRAGAVYVFERDLGGSDQWGETKKLLASDGASLGRFGGDVAIFQDTAVVGASDQAYVLGRNQGGASNWGEVKILTPPATNVFGAKTDLFADTIAVSGDDQVHIFERNLGGDENWGESTVVAGSDASAISRFGNSVALEGDFLLVGAPTADSGGVRPGAAYLFNRNEGGIDSWGEQRKLVASDQEDLDWFSASIALSGTTAVAGAPNNSENGPDSGSVYWYRLEDIASFRVQGDLSGLATYEAIQLALNGAFELLLTSNDIFEFPVGLPDGAPFDVSIVEAEPTKTCSTEDASGVINGGNAFVDVSCNDRQFTVGGLIQSPGGNVTLELNRTEQISLDGAGPFVFSTTLTHSSSYLVRVVQSDLSCIVENASGWVNAGSIDDLIVVCDEQSASLDGFVSGLFADETITINHNHRVEPLVVGNGSFSFPTSLPQGASYWVTIQASPRRCSVVNGQGTVTATDTQMVEIDCSIPRITPAQRLSPPDARSSDGFGDFSRVAVDDDVAVVGAPDAIRFLSQVGSAAVFQMDLNGAWGWIKALVPEDGKHGDEFGVSVDSSGDLALVGARRANGIEVNSGAAYLFEQDLGGTNNWGQRQKLIASNGSVGASFGSAVALDDDWIAIGSPDRQTVHLFLRGQGGVWTELKTLSMTDSSTRFGERLVLQGDTLAVAAPGANLSGAVFVYRRDQGGPEQWGQVAQLSDAEPTLSGFGQALDLEGDQLLIGASRTGNRGSAYLFERNQGGPDAWGQVHRFANEETASGFASAVAIGEDLVGIGAYGADDGGVRSGIGWLYARNQGGVGNWGLVAALGESTRNSLDFNDRLGSAIEIDGQTIIIGAGLDDTDNLFDSGGAYVYSIDSNETFSIGGMVSGLVAGNTVLLQNNGDEQLVVTGNGPFAFPNRVFNGAGYQVTADTVAFTPNQVCEVTDGIGVISDADATVSIQCSAEYFHVGGQVEGLLDGSAVEIQLNGSSNLVLDVNGVFQFPDELIDGSSYRVSLVDSTLDCVVTDFEGVVARAEVDTVRVNCAADSFAISGQVLGLAESERITLQNNAADAITVGNGPFTFPSLYPDGARPWVTVMESTRRCQVTNGRRVIQGADRDDVEVNCVSPRLVEDQGGAASHQRPEDHFGSAVAIDDEYAIIGAWGAVVDGRRSGAAYVYQRSPQGNWQPTDRLIVPPTDGQFSFGPEGGFGFTVAISENYAVVGAPFLTGTAGDGAVRRGFAFLFERRHGASEWRFIKAFTETPGFGENVAFGSGVDIDDQTLAIWGGASVHIYSRDEGGMGTWGKLASVPVVTITESIRSLALEGDVLVADSLLGATVFERNLGGPNQWGERTTLGLEADDSFGQSIDIFEDTIVVGSPRENITGEVFVFERNLGGLNNWGEAARLDIAGVSRRRAGSFGESVAIDSNLIAVGSNHDDIGHRPGIVLLFERAANDSQHWGEIVALGRQADGPANVPEALQSFFGSAVGLNRQTIVIGADNSQREGSAYFYSIESTDREAVFSDGFEAFQN